MFSCARVSMYEDAVLKVVSRGGSSDRDSVPKRTSSFIFIDDGRLLTSQEKSSTWLSDPILGNSGLES